MGLTKADLVNCLNSQLKPLIEQLKTIQESLTDVRDDLVVVKQDVVGVVQENIKLKQQMLMLESNSKRLNLCFIGFDRNKGETAENVVIRHVKEKLKISLKETDFVAVWFAENDSCKQPIIVQFIAMKTRLQVLSAANKLKSFASEGHPLIIRPDRPRMQRQAEYEHRVSIRQARKDRELVRWSGSKLFAGNELIVDLFPTDVEQLQDSVFPSPSAPSANTRLKKSSKS